MADVRVAGSGDIDVLASLVAAFGRPYWTARPEVVIEDLYVEPAARGRGHGRALLRAAISTAREQGAGHLELTTTEEDVAAAALYRAEGLRETEYAAPGSGRVIWFGLDL